LAVIPLRGFRGVPRYSEIEYCCRYAGEEPKSTKAGRKRRDRKIGRLLSRDDISRADLRVVGDYLKGRFGRKPGQGRPVNYQQAHAWHVLAEGVEAIRRERRCSRDEAQRTFLKENLVKMLVIENGVERWITSDDDPDGELFAYIRNYLNR
jgi:hypothetical protein